MKKKYSILYLIVCIYILTSCQGKSLYELEQKSLESGVYNDTIINNLLFGMGKLETYHTIGWNSPDDGVVLNLDGLRNSRFNIYPAFFNDSLSSITFTTAKDLVYNNIREKDIINIYTGLYGNPIFKDNEEWVQKRIWLKDNLKITVLTMQTDGFDIYAIKYSDLRRENSFRKVDSDQIVVEFNYLDGETLSFYPDDNIYTKEYLKNKKDIPNIDENYISYMEQQSLSSGKEHSKILGNLSFGIEEKDVWEALQIKPQTPYSLNIKGLEKCKFIVTPYTLNDKFNKLVLYAYTGGELGYYLNGYFAFDINSAVAGYKNLYGAPTIQTVNNFIWLDGNLKIEIKYEYNDEERFKSLRIEYSDLRNHVTELDILSGKTVRYGNIYQTKQYIKDNEPYII